MNNTKKDMVDNLTVLEQAEIIKNRAEELKIKHKSMSNGLAFTIAIDELLRGTQWNY